MMHIKIILYLCLLGLATARQRQRASRFRKPKVITSEIFESQTLNRITEESDNAAEGTDSDPVPTQRRYIPVSVDFLRNYYQQYPPPHLPQPTVPAYNPQVYASNGYNTAPSQNRPPIPVLVKPQYFNFQQINSPSVNNAQIPNIPEISAFLRPVQNPLYSGSNSPRQLIPVPVILDSPSNYVQNAPINPYFANRNDDVSDSLRYQTVSIPARVPPSQYQAQLQNHATLQQTQATQSNDISQAPVKSVQSVPLNIVGNSQINVPLTQGAAQNNFYTNSIEYLRSLVKANSGREPSVYIGTKPASKSNGAYSPSTEVSRVSYVSNRANYSF